MRRRSLMTWGLAGFGLQAAADAQNQAQAQVRELWRRYRHGVETEQETVRLHIERAGQATETKRLQRSIRFRVDGGFLVLVRFVEPALDKGLSLLIDQAGHGPAQLWLRMPSWPQARRIAGEREARSFGGTDLTFEDNRQLLGERLDDWQYRALEMGLIEATPRTASGYGKRLLRLRGDGELAQIDYYDPQGRALKTQLHEKLSLEAGRWRAERVRVQHQQEPRSTLLEVEERRFGMPMSEAWFQSQLAA